MPAKRPVGAAGAPLAHELVAGVLAAIVARGGEAGEDGVVGHFLFQGLAREEEGAFA